MTTNGFDLARGVLLKNTRGRGTLAAPRGWGAPLTADKADDSCIVTSIRRAVLLSRQQEEALNGSRPNHIPQFGMFGRRCRADDGGADMSSDLRRGNADAATRRMHKNGLAPFQSAHDDHKLPRREVIDWKCCSFQGGHTRRAGEDLLHGYANHIRIAAEPGHGQDIAADPARIDIRARGIQCVR